MNNKDGFEGNRRDSSLEDTQWVPSSLGSRPQEVSDATQRVRVDANGRSQTSPARRSATGSTRPSSAAKTSGPQKNARKKQRQKNTLIILCCIAAVLLVAVIIIAVMLLRQGNTDDGLILKNVFAAGVDLSGMTQEEAKDALHEATDDTYTKLDMTVEVLNSTIALSPADTNAKLDVDAVVEAAYNYGRTGSRSEQQNAKSQAQNSSYTVPILDYLNLDTDYIESVINDLGVQYSTTLKQTTYELEGERPDLGQTDVDTDTVYQTLTIYMGTAEYSLNTDMLYEQILDAYEINLFQVTGQCTMVAPDALDYEQIYEEMCVAPTNALFDTETYLVTEEVYGYGFTLEDLKSAVESAEYGSEITLSLRFIEPDITADFYSNEIFQDTLSSFSTKISGGSDWKTNVTLACEAINGTIIKAGESFSFNDVVGEPTTRNGYKSVSIYLGKANQNVTGGGICQVASTLYYCALQADLEITERHGHSYTVNYIQNGFDAEIYDGSMDLSFTNTTEYPIRIDAEVVSGEVKITLIGTDTKDYTVKLSYKTTETYEPSTVYNIMPEKNPGGYKDGDVLSTGITGYCIKTYLIRNDKETGEKISEDLIAETVYAKRDKVVVQIYVEPEPETEPTTVPTEPEDLEPDSTVPGGTTPAETTQPATPVPTETPTETIAPTPTEVPSETTTAAPTEDAQQPDPTPTTTPGGDSE